MRACSRPRRRSLTSRARLARASKSPRRCSSPCTDARLGDRRARLPAGRPDGNFSGELKLRRGSMRTRILAVSATLAATLSLPSIAQQRVVTAADYARAERFMSYETTPLVFGTAVRPTWLPDDRFWYRSVAASGADLVVVDPARATRTSIFADNRLAGAVAAALS